MLRTPGIEPVVVIGQRDKQACSRTSIAFYQEFPGSQLRSVH